MSVNKKRSDNFIKKVSVLARENRHPILKNGYKFKILL